MANYNLNEKKPARYLKATDITKNPDSNPNATKKITYKIKEAYTRKSPGYPAVFKYTLEHETTEETLLDALSFSDTPMGWTAFMEFLKDSGIENNIDKTNFDPMELTDMVFTAEVGLKLNPAFDPDNKKSEPFHPKIVKYTS